MIEKRERIARSAADLFATQGYDATTTQEIADRADVSIGTVFRYAASKAELLLMVYNAAFAEGVRRGLGDAARPGEAGERVLAMIAPILELSRATRDVALYQRELMFGPADEQYRGEGLAIVADLEDGIAAVLAEQGGTVEQARDAASSVFAVLHLAIVRREAAIGAASAPDLASQVRQIVAGHRRATITEEAGTTRGGGRE